MISKVDVLEGDFATFGEVQRSRVGLVLCKTWSIRGRTFSLIVLPPLAQGFPLQACTESPCQVNSASFPGISYPRSLMEVRVETGVGSP